MLFLRKSGGAMHKTPLSKSLKTDPVTIAAVLFLLSGAALGVLLGIAFIAALPFPLPIAVPVAWLVVYRLPWWMVRRG